VSAIDVDLLDPAFYADLDGMHEVFARWRRDDPVHRDERNGLWAVTRHADVVDVERRATTFVSGLGYRSFHSPGEDNMIAQDDPGHAEQRGVVARRLTPKAVQRHEPYLRTTVAELLDAVAPEGRMEVVDALAARLPGRLTASLLGFPEDRWRDVKSWSERMMRYDRMQVDPEALMGTMSSIQEFSEVLFPTYAARKAEPQDDLVSAWAQAPGCPYDDQAKLINETGLFISGGAETTRTVIARGLRVLCDHPDQWEAVVADPSLVPSAVEELIRWVTPLNNFFRTAVADSTIGDQEVNAGDRVILLYPSANRDEDVFADPFAFDVRRSPNPQVAFGFGPHVCIGAPLARLELRILFEELTRRFTNLRVVTEPEIEENIFASAVVRFDLAFDRR
jgi:cytochrome P450 family 142 subfamily A polypeptide 1